MKYIVFWVASFFSIGFLAASESLPPQGGPQDSKGLLWLLDKNPSELSVELQNLTKALAAGRVPTREKAVSVATKDKFESGGVLLAEERFYVSDLLVMGHEIPDFAKVGDLVWVVRLTDQFCRGCTTQELWLNARTESIKRMLPYSPRERRSTNQ